MALENVSSAMPEHLKNVLIEGEITYHFSWTDLNKTAGCGGGDQAKSCTRDVERDSDESCPRRCGNVRLRDKVQRAHGL